MPRALAPLLLGTTLLWGCVAQPPVDPTANHAAGVVSTSSVDEWLDQLAAVEKMDAAQIRQRLEAVDNTASASDRFYFGALNQRLQNYGAWTVARDTFQALAEDTSLSKQQRQLAGLLQQYNQSRINGHSRYTTLLKQQADTRESLNRAEAQQRQLQQKIQALTELETTISTRQED